MTVAWKRDFSRTKFLHKNFPSSLTLSYTITKKPKQKFCVKVIEGPKTPEGLSDRVFFRILSDSVPFRFFSNFSFLDSLDFSVVGSSLWSSVTGGPLWVHSDRLFKMFLSDRFLYCVISPLFPVCQYFLIKRWYRCFIKNRSSVLPYIFKKTFTLNN